MQARIAGFDVQLLLCGEVCGAVVNDVAHPFDWYVLNVLPFRGHAGAYVRRKCRAHARFMKGSLLELPLRPSSGDNHRTIL